VTYELTTILAILTFLATFIVVAIGKLPVYHIDRAGAALLGGSLMVGFGVLSADEAYRAIDFDTIMLLLGMMIVVANLRVAGFFSAHQQLDRDSCSSSVCVACSRRRGIGCSLCLSCQRHYLSGDDAPRARIGYAA
jgi:Citrate transporter